jgi:prepilin-type N-terminal cleavage/methylation domain-containing protein
MNSSSGFTLIEILLVVLLVALSASVVIPLSIDYLNRQEEKKQILEIVTQISTLKKKSISYLQLAEIKAENNSLILMLDRRIEKDFSLPHQVYMEQSITFNQNGVSNGGEIKLRFSKEYVIKIEKWSGRISLENAP